MKLLKEHTPRFTEDRFREWVEVDLSNPRDVFAAQHEEGLGHCAFKTVDEKGNVIPFVWPSEPENKE